MYELSDVALIGLLALAGYYWWRAHGVRELALRAAREHCQQLQVQLLDDGVARRGFWLKRGDDGRLHIWRSYQFEFTATGDDRYQGRVFMLGQRVEAIRLETHRIH
jgi:hypothetical protein